MSGIVPAGDYSRDQAFLTARVACFAILTKVSCTCIGMTVFIIVASVVVCARRALSVNAEAGVDAICIIAAGRSRFTAATIIGNTNV